MKTTVFLDEATQARLELGPFHAFLDDYVGELRRIGYPDTHFKKAFRVIIRLSDWTGLKHIPPRELTVARMEEFWVFHGSICNHRDFRVLGDFLKFLRARGLVPEAPAESKTLTRAENMLFLFERYLREEKGLSVVYIYQLVRVAKFFLKETFLTADENWARYTAKMIGDYFTRLLREKTPSEVRASARHLAQFFKFLFLKGETEIDLSKAVPHPANWRHTRLPIYLEPDKVERLLESCDRENLTGARDYAVLILLSRLGLRGCEVKNLNLNDLHWRESAITVRGKGKESRMPIPMDVGEALAAYVKKSRPKTPSRSVFVSVFPPYHGLKRTASVSGIVRFALERAGIESKYKGAHLLRHTVANQCLRNGGSLHDVGVLLRHEQLATSSIYAKVDFPRLALIARPWIGGAK